MAMQLSMQLRRQRTLQPISGCRIASSSQAQFVAAARTHKKSCCNIHTCARIRRQLFNAQHNIPYATSMRSVRARTHASALSLIHVHVQAHSMSICHASHQLLKLPHARCYSYRGRVGRWQLHSTSTSCWRQLKRRWRTQQQLPRPALSRCS